MSFRTAWRAAARALIVFGSCGVLIPAADAAGFPNTCAPFGSIAKTHAIDGKCGLDGKVKSEGNRVQNRAKNNLCAQGQAGTMSFQAFADLQDAVDQAGIPFGSSNNLPETRDQLQQMGEGKLVRLAAYVLDAKYSNTSSGESVNCKLKGAANNDIHIALGSSADADACESVTAEMIPHFRPSQWTPAAVSAVGTHPVRITGQLFFDGSHIPCRNGQAHSPERVSVWEIHPVYAMEVCKNRRLSSCDADDDSVWTPLHQWGTQPIEDVTDDADH